MKIGCVVVDSLREGQRSAGYQAIAKYGLLVRRQAQMQWFMSPWARTTHGHVKPSDCYFKKPKQLHVATSIDRMDINQLSI